MNLDELRRHIDQIDEQIIQLLDQRASLAVRIGSHKQGSDTAVYDATREAQILRQLAQYDTSSLPQRGAGKHLSGNTGSLPQHSAAIASGLPGSPIYLHPYGGSSAVWYYLRADTVWKHN